MKFSIAIRSLVISLGISGCVFAVPPRTQAAQRPLQTFVSRTQQQALAREAATQVQQATRPNSLRHAANTASNTTDSLLSIVVRTMNTSGAQSEKDKAKKLKEALIFDVGIPTALHQVPQLLTIFFRENWLIWTIRNAYYPYLLWRQGLRETTKIAMVDGIAYASNGITGRLPLVFRLVTSFALNHYLHTYVVDPFVDGIAGVDKNQGEVS